jgi:predicted transcriptional regulator
MPTLTTQTLDSTETAIMNVVWSYDAPMTIQQVHTVLLFRGVAYTTIMTTMYRLVEKGILTCGDRSAGVGGAYRYMPALTRDTFLAASVEHLRSTLGTDRDDHAEALAMLGVLR